MKISLVQPPVWGVYGPPTGLAQLSSCLKGAGHETSVFDMNVFLYRKRAERYKNNWAIEQSSFWCSPGNVNKFFDDNKDHIEEYVDSIAEGGPAMVCFSVNVCSWNSAKLLASMLKSRLPGARIVMGGPVFLVKYSAEDYLLGSDIDIIVYGESEITIQELAGLLERKEDLSVCKGLCFKKDGSIVKTESRPLLSDLDVLPFMDFTDMPFSDYDPPGHMGKHISIMTSRGCVQQCVFCGPRKYWPGYRTMSGKRIFEEIEYHLKSNPDVEHIEFLDLLLNGSMKTLSQFCDLMSSVRSGTKPHWHANLIVRKEMTIDIFKKMYSAGCRHVTFGIESGSQRVLGLMMKKYRIEDADSALKNARQAGIGVTCNFMFGFPGETREDFELTLQFLKRNKDSISIAYPSRTFCTIEPYSYMQENLSEFDMIPNIHHGQYWVSKDGANNYLVRMKRCEEFSETARQLGVDIGLGLQTSYELDHWLNMGDYYFLTGDMRHAAECFEEYLKLDVSNASVREKLCSTGYGK